MFEPTILEGQLCYSLDVKSTVKKPTKTGKHSGLLLLIDPNPYPTQSTYNTAKYTFKVYIHTLAQHTAFGPGAYAMHTLKKMTGTTSFYQMPDSQKKCQVHSREECQTEIFLNQVRNSCSCVPWALTTENNAIEVISMLIQTILKK